MVAYKMLDIGCGYGMKVRKGLYCPTSSAIFLVCKALEQTWIGFDPLCLEKRVLVLQLQTFHQMTEDGKRCICEVWCGKGDANSIKEWCDNMFRTVTVLDLGLECCQMLELGINRCITL